MAIRVLLDTCTVRHFIYEDPGHLDLSRIRGSKSDLLISIAYPASLEILDDMLNAKPFPFTAWGKRARQLDSVLDQELPLFPGGIHLASLLGMDGVERLTDDEKLMYRKTWDLMKGARRRFDLANGITCYDSTGKRAISLDRPTITAEISSERQWWAESFRKFEDIAKQKGTSVRQVTSIIAGLEPEPLSKAYCLFLTLKQKGYDPTSGKRKGDVFDFSLLAALPLPAVVVTHDKKFVNNVRQTKARQAELLVTVNEFHEKLEKDQLESLLGNVEKRSRRG